MTSGIEDAKQLIAASDYPVILTGAGISSESGVPTFRGEDGLWKNYRAENLATPQAFSSNPELVWEWYNWRRSIIQEKSPNSAHYAIVDLQKKFPNMPVITQNVDNLHNISGAKNVIEMHGNIFRARCTSCRQVCGHSTVDDNRPKCSVCGGYLRPDIVWFGETLNPEIMRNISIHLHRSDLFIVIGTSGNVYPAAGFAAEVNRSGGKVIEINPEPVLSFALKLHGKAGDIFPLIVKV